MDSRIILTIFAIILIYTLYYTYNNDFGMFLYIVLLIILGLFIYEYVENKINTITSKVEDKINIVKSEFDNGLQNLNNIKNIIVSSINGYK